ncbi:unnamed protein product [Cuscuta campestris]|uniref:Uncharacterized protein n=1 Tax=Cuscuta campestris TaxID=132261 RepID=A0A484N9C0_9ASTE|nr:unnamed protein product [Cuscuta campestris]
MLLHVPRLVSSLGSLPEKPIVGLLVDVALEDRRCWDLHRLSSSLSWIRACQRRRPDLVWCRRPSIGEGGRASGGVELEK